MIIFIIIYSAICLSVGLLLFRRYDRFLNTIDTSNSIYGMEKDINYYER